MKKNHSILILAAALGLTGQAQAVLVTVITPTAVSFTDTIGADSLGSINNLINNSGLSASIGSTVDTAALPTISEANPEVSGWRRNGTDAPAVDFTFDLSTAGSFNGIIIGNYWEPAFGGLGYRGVSTFGLEISTNNGSTYTFAQTVNPAQSTGNLEYIPLGTTYTGVTNVKFNNATYFSGDGANIMGLNEVRFTIPEPSAAALAGLAGLGLALRRRRA